MTHELDKIELFLAEARRLWDRNPELVTSRTFYDMWEQAQHPRPFALAEPALELGGHVFPLPHDRNRIACVRWDPEDMCPCLTLEGEHFTQRFLIFFEDGNVHIEERDPTLLTDDELSFGERLEVIYDVIAYLREACPALDIAALRKRDVTEALRAIASWHAPHTIALMRRMSANAVRRLLEKAVEDMAEDELTQQLSLPLDGSYAVRRQRQVTSAGTAEREFQRSPVRCSVAERTLWEAQQDLDLLAAANRLAEGCERTFFVVLRDAAVIEDEDGRTLSADGSMLLRIDIEPGAPVREGDLMRVYERGVDEMVGTLSVEILEETAAYARLEWSEPRPHADLGTSLYARPPHSPLPFMLTSLEALRQQLRQTPDDLPGAVAPALGTVATSFTRPVTAAADAPDMDASQRDAWACAVHDDNRIALIQGPPGTGKSWVLRRVVRTLCKHGGRLLITAPSNTAVDNICRHLTDLPVLRFGRRPERISPDVADQFWALDLDNVRRFANMRENQGCSVYAGTHLGLLRADIVLSDLAKDGPFDAILLDEAGMAGVDEVLLCLTLARRAILFGDHQQLPPYPLPQSIFEDLNREFGAMTRHQWSLLKRSALQWLAEQRSFPVMLLQRSYRCQNPRLMRFSSTLFYDARVTASDNADYYRLSYRERQATYPPGTLTFYSTSALPLDLRGERLVVTGGKPGLENQLEARLCLQLLRNALASYPAREITIIAPYRRQTKLLRDQVTLERLKAWSGDDSLEADDLHWFRHNRIATVDSFQGGESDLVIICYVRSNRGAGIGFVDAPNRINVAHTRCRRELHVVGDLDCLKAQAESNIFERMERAFRRDGEIAAVTADEVAGLPDLLPT